MFSPDAVFSSTVSLAVVEEKTGGRFAPSRTVWVVAFSALPGPKLSV